VANFSRVILLGRLTRDAELRYSGGGMAVCTFSLAVNRRTKKDENWEDEASFFDVVAFGKTAEGKAEYLGKGKQVLVEGELVQRRWEDKDGQKRSKVEIYANGIQFIGPKPEGAGGGPSRSAKSAPDAGGSDDAPPSMTDDEIPF
jgi:single-strand DNA-binding protein